MKKNVATLSAVMMIGIMTVQAQAGTIVGTAALTDFGRPTVNTGAIDTSTTFTIAKPLSTLNVDGIFSSAGFDFLNKPVTFTVGGPITIGSSAFGTFTSTAIIDSGSTAGFRNFDAIGLYTGGTDTVPGIFSAELRLTFSQTPDSAKGVISDSGTLAVFSGSGGPNTVPEPSSLALAALGGIGALIGVFRRRISVSV